MLDLGTVRPGTTLYIPFSSFAGSTGASVTMTGIAVTDIECYKDGGTTQRASDAGYALLDTDGIDIDSITGIHGFSIDLADNTTAGFWASGSQYWVVVSSVTVDAQTVNFIACTFRIGYPDAVLNTTIATLSSQTSFTLTVGPAEDDALNGCQVVIHDVASAVQVGRAVILDYTGATKTVTLAAGTTFTAAATDNIAVLGLAPLQPTVTGRTLDVSTGGEAGVDWANVGTPGSTVSLSATTVSLVTTTTTATTATNVTTVNGLAAGVITATSIAADAITAAKIADGAIDAATLASDTITAAKIATDAFTAAKFAADCITAAKIADGAIDAATFAAGAINAAAIASDAITDAKVASDVTIASVTGAVGSVTGAVGSVTGAVGSVTGNVGGNVTGTIGGFTTAAKAEIQTEAEDAIVTHRLDELLNADSDIDGAAPPTVGSVFHELLSKTAGSFTFDQTTDSLEAIRDRGDAAWVTATSVTVSDKTGFSLANGSFVTATFGTCDLTATMKASVNTEADTALSDVGVTTTITGRIDVATSTRMATYTQPTGFLAATFPTTVASTTNITAASGVAISGTTTTLDALQTALNSAHGSGSWATATGFSTHTAADVWASATRVLTAGTNIVLAKGTGVTGFTDITAAQVNAEVVDALATDTYAQPTGVPSATVSLSDKIGRLYQAMTSELTVTASAKTFYTHGGAALWKKTLADSGTEYSETDGAAP